MQEAWLAAHLPDCCFVLSFLQQVEIVGAVCDMKITVQTMASWLWAYWQLSQQCHFSSAGVGMGLTG